jgi:hypothetical protein
MCSKKHNSQNSDDNQGDEDVDDNDDYYSSFMYTNFFLKPVLALCITDDFPLFSANFNAGACKFDIVLSVVSELIM